MLCRAEHFVHFLRRFVEYLRKRVSVRHVEAQNSAAFLEDVAAKVAVDGKSLRFCYDRLGSLMKTLELYNTDDYLPIQLVADFGTLIGTYDKGFAIIIEPHDDRLPSVPDPVVQLACLDASLAIKPVFEKYQARRLLCVPVHMACSLTVYAGGGPPHDECDSRRRMQTVVITSGTLSPIDLYPRILDFSPVSIASLSMTLTRECLCPVVLTRGADQMPVSSKYEMRKDETVVRCAPRPLRACGTVCTTSRRWRRAGPRAGTTARCWWSYRAWCPTASSVSSSPTSTWIRSWRSGTPWACSRASCSTSSSSSRRPTSSRRRSPSTTSAAPATAAAAPCSSASRAARSPRASTLTATMAGAPLPLLCACAALRPRCGPRVAPLTAPDLCVRCAAPAIWRARGDGCRCVCRAVVMFGVPYQYTLSRILQARLEYLEQTFQIKDSDFLAFDAVRQASQCVGRVIRSKADYGMMVFADKRYQRHDKRDKLPRWISSHLSSAHLDLSTDMLVHIARDFMRAMAQPLAPAAIGKVLLSADDLAARHSAAGAPAEAVAAPKTAPIVASTVGRRSLDEARPAQALQGDAEPMDVG